MIFLIFSELLQLKMKRHKAKINIYHGLYETFHEPRDFGVENFISGTWVWMATKDSQADGSDDLSRGPIIMI